MSLEMKYAEIATITGWTYQEIEKQPQWLLDALLIKKSTEAWYMSKKAKLSKHGTN